jgi:hypothetical protein
MKKTLLLCGALLALSASAALAAGINLSWNDCNAFGQENQTFACASNTGLPHTLVASFIAPAGVNQYIAFESELEIVTDSATLPEWWKIRGTGQCRTGALTNSADFTTGPFNCFDQWLGSASGGIGAYDLNYTGDLNRSHVKLVWAVPPEGSTALSEGVEYYAFKLAFSNAKTTGTGSCAGCLIPACINMRYILLDQPSVLLDNRKLTNPAPRAHAKWQSASDAICAGATPTRNSTWGSVKALYR